MQDESTTVTRHPHVAHWGPFSALVRAGKLIGVEAFSKDPHPTALINSIPEAVHSKARIRQPMVRTGWLDAGPGGAGQGRGSDRFVAVGWDEALDLVSAELTRVKSEHGNDSIFAGSYGWASAGRFHHAKSQLKRFMNLHGGFTDQTGTYSNATGHVLLPHVVGDRNLARGPFTSWDSIEANTDLIVAFGGIGLKNTQVEPGGMGEHSAHHWLLRLRAADVDVVSITPLKDDSAQFLNAQWLAPRPGSDVALMLALTHCLIEENLHDETFLARYCVGFDEFRGYLFGAEDGQVKDAQWAAGLSEIDADTIRDLARRMAAGRTMISVAYALQRAEFGEQPYWAAMALAAVLGQVGLPGGGFGLGYGSMHGYGNPSTSFARPTLSTGSNPTSSVIPVARIADMFLHPGEPYQFNGDDKHYPDARFVYWCGGNPFHHHQDLNRLARAWQRPETIVVNEIFWTATARRADIVLPATTTLERNDIGASGRDRFILAMHRAVDPVGEARCDFDIFSGLARRLGFEDAFTEGRTEMEWLRHIYDVSRQQASEKSVELPDFDEFWKAGHAEIPRPDKHYVVFENFRADPQTHPLGTPSGRIEICSDTIASFGYDDCPGHPAWLAPTEWLGSEGARTFPLHLISNQPKTRLHGQMDDCVVSREGKVSDREPITINRADARARGIRAGDVVRVFNDRGAVLAGAVISDDVRLGVVCLPTGAWFDPSDPTLPASLEKHGNPNVLTRDFGTSRLTQGPTAHSTLVEVEVFAGIAPAVTAFEPPQVRSRDA
jgi:biotin/methionine sulfoxide reductase